MSLMLCSSSTSSQFCTLNFVYLWAYCIWFFFTNAIGYFSTPCLSTISPCCLNSKKKITFYFKIVSNRQKNCKSGTESSCILTLPRFHQLFTFFPVYFIMFSLCVSFSLYLYICIYVHIYTYTCMCILLINLLRVSWWFESPLSLNTSIKYILLHQ